jgi:hypothetical protein
MREVRRVAPRPERSRWVVLCRSSSPWSTRNCALDLRRTSAMREGAQTMRGVFPGAESTAAIPENRSKSQQSVN